MENKISFVMTPEALNNISKATETIVQNLPELINLTGKERQTLTKMGDKSYAFVSKALEYAKQNPKIVPAFLNITEFEKDTVGFDNLRKVLNSLLQLTEKLDDTTMLTGSEAFSEALAFYTAVRGAAKAGEPGMKTIYADLQSRYPRRTQHATPAAV